MVSGQQPSVPVTSHRSGVRVPPRPPWSEQVSCADAEPACRSENQRTCPTRESSSCCGTAPMVQQTFGATVHVGPAGPGALAVPERVAVICSMRMPRSVRRAIRVTSADWSTTDSTSLSSAVCVAGHRRSRTGAAAAIVSTGRPLRRRSSPCVPCPGAHDRSVPTVRAKAGGRYTDMGGLAGGEPASGRGRVTTASAADCGQAGDAARSPGGVDRPRLTGLLDSAVRVALVVAPRGTARPCSHQRPTADGADSPRSSFTRHW